jgi:hypothetical protein
MCRFAIVLAAMLLANVAAARQPAITFGKWLPVKWSVGPAEDKTLDLQVRGLSVNGSLREFTIGEPRDITDRLFVVRRAYRINDRLPEDPKKLPKWKWQRGGWLLVDKLGGRVSELKLPYFDPFYSAASWYRDYVAYCGLSDDAEKLYAIVARIGERQPVVRKELGPAKGAEMPDSECDTPTWQRPPVRVTFAPKGGQAVTFAIRGRGGDLLAPEAEPPDKTGDSSAVPEQSR